MLQIDASQYWSDQLAISVPELSWWDRTVLTAAPPVAYAGGFIAGGPAGSIIAGTAVAGFVHGYERFSEGQTLGQSVGGGLSDASGLTQLVGGIWNVDVATGEYLNWTTGERWTNGILGGVQLAGGIAALGGATTFTRTISLPRPAWLSLPQIPWPLPTLAWAPAFSVSWSGSVALTRAGTLVYGGGLLANNGLAVFSSTSPTNPIRSGEIGTFENFTSRSKVGDELEGHELLQHAWLRRHGHATTRLSTEASRKNPVIALKRLAHKLIRPRQRFDLDSQTAVENIIANRRIMLELGFSRKRVNKLTWRAIQHVMEHGL